MFMEELEGAKSFLFQQWSLSRSILLARDSCVPPLNLSLKTTSQNAIQKQQKQCDW